MFALIFTFIAEVFYTFNFLQGTSNYRSFNSVTNPNLTTPLSHINSHNLKFIFVSIYNPLESQS